MASKSRPLPLPLPLPRRRCCAVFLLLACLLAARPLWAASGSSSAWGDLDPGFASSGGMGTYFVGSGSRDRATELKLTPDGRLVAAGYTHNGDDNDLLVMRFWPDGSPDQSFGGGRGHVIFGGGGDQMALGLALQNDGKIVLTGRTSSQGDNQVLTLRLNFDGSLDTSFGDQGAAVFKGPAGGTDTGRAVEVQPDGKILVAGEISNGAEKNAMVLRYLAHGELDPSFGQAGLATLAGAGGADDWAFDLALRADGRILVTGGLSAGKTEDVLLWRLTSEGLTDQSFAAGGVATWAGPGGQRDYGNALALDQQGRILVAGADHDGENYNIVLLAFLADGGLDPSFGQGGVARCEGNSEGYDYVWGLALGDQGRILLAGSSQGQDGDNPVILCFLPEGVLDQSFAQAGVFRLAASGRLGRAYDLAVSEDGGVLAAGYLSDGGRDEVLLFRLLGR